MEEKSPLELIPNENNNTEETENMQSTSDFVPVSVKEEFQIINDAAVTVTNNTSLIPNNNDNNKYKGGNNQREVHPIEEPIEMNADFVWNDYLEDTDSTAAPPTSFFHVEQSLESGFKEGMKLEVPNRHNADTYWIATIVVTCGPLLRLRYEGCDDRAAEFWSDVGSSEMHPLGWGEKNNKILEPPQGMTCKVETDVLVKTLKNAQTVPAGLLDAHGATPIEQLKQGMHVEVEEEFCRQRVRIASIVRNVGGRLLLRYIGEECPAKDFWLFYLSYRLHHVGWAKENLMENEENAGVETTLEDYFAAPCEIFQNQETIRTHGFRVGLAMETLNPFCPNQFCIATVTKILNEYYFEITAHVSSSSQSDSSSCDVIRCHADSPFIFPVGWSQERMLKFTYPSGYSNHEKDFDWNSYLKDCNVEAAPTELFNLVVPDHCFEASMKLEAVNPLQSEQVCVATITKVVDNLLWVQLENTDNFTCIIHVKSHDIFPVGWCESNSYPLQAPILKSRFTIAKKAAMVTRSMQKLTDVTAGKVWCPYIYFNHKCFSGPYLSKGRIAELPRQVGPGSVTLVMKEVLSLIVNVAYQSSRVLTELSARGHPSPGMQHQVLKAKYKGKSYKAMVEIVRSSDKVAEFCRSICKKLECCPYLFGPKFVGEDCPENCSGLTKTKYTPCSRRRRRMGRPPGTLKKTGVNTVESGKDLQEDPPGVNIETVVENLESVKKEEKESQEGDVAKAEESVEVPPVKKRKYVHKVHPKLEIVTRKAKLPNYALQLRRRRRRKSISPSQSSNVSSVSSTASAIEAESEVSKDSSAPSPTSTVFPEVVTKSETIHKSIQVALPIFDILQLDKSPLLWSVDEVVHYIKSTDCAHLARLLKDQEIDGQALLLLTLPTVQEHLELKLGPAMLLCQHIEKIKLAFFAKFAN